MQDLSGFTVAVLATDGFEQSQLAEPKRRLSEAGARVHIVSPKAGRIRGWVHGDWGDTFAVDRQLADVTTEGYDALVLPGGQINPDLLRTHDRAVAFVRAMHAAGKPVAAICHGPWMLVEADVLRGRNATSFHSIRTDLRNAGAVWVDEATVVDGNIVTARRPADVGPFCAALAEALARAGRPREMA